MACPCTAEYAAIEAAIVSVEAAITAGNTARATFEMELGAALSACCDTWAAQGAGSFNIPATSTTVACPDGSTVTCGTPAVTATTANWAGTYMYGIASAAQSNDLASQLYNDQYNAWLAAYEQWRQSQIIPQIVALGLQIASIVAMYDQWTEYLKKTNKMICGIADTAFPKALADFCAIDGDYTAHVETLSTNFETDFTALRERTDWHCDKADLMCACYFEDGATGAGAGYAILEKQHAQNMAQNMNNISTAAQWSAQDLKNEIMGYRADSAATFDAWRDGEFDNLTNQIEALFAKAPEICDYINTCGQMLVDGYNNGMADDVRAYLEEQVACGTECLALIKESITDADAFMTEQQTLYAKYNAAECVFAPEVIEGATTLLQSQDIELATHDWLAECAMEFKDKYELGVGVNEEALAAKILELACRLVTTGEESVEFKGDLAEECLAHWQDNYAGCDAILGEGIMAEAKLLMTDRKSTFDEFVANHDAFYDCWLNHYKPLEHEYSEAILTKATELVGTLCTNITEICDEADDFLDKFKQVWQGAECATALKVIEAGITACEQQIDSYEGLDNLFDELFDKWFQEICACDLTDIQRACAIWDKTDPTCELSDNSDCAQDIVEQIKRCYLTLGLACEKEYIQELCDLPEYQPKYCELEDRAMLHIRRRFDIARENLMRAGTRYCAEDIKEQLCKLEAEQARQEAAALMAANRFERWWEVQESDRRHRYKLDMMNCIKQLPLTAFQGLSTSTQALDSILTQVHNRLNRSYNYLSQANSAGSSAANSAAQGVNQALNGIQLGHYWTDHHLALKREANNQAAGLVLRGQEQSRIGHTYMTQSTNALNAAENTARGAIQDGLNAMTHGRQFKQLALAGSQAESQDVQAMEGLALQHVDRGHFWIQEARSYRGQAWQTVNDSIRNAQQQVQLGHDTLNQLMAFEQQRDQLIQMCRDNGMQAAAHGLEMAQVGNQKVERALQSAERAITDGLNVLQMGQRQDSQWLSSYHNLAALGAGATGAYNGVVSSGHNALQLSANMAQMGYQHKAAMCDKICDAVRDRNVTMYQQLLGFSATAGQAAQLSQQFGGALANSLDGLIGTVQGLTGGPPSLLNGAPTPGGNSNVNNFGVPNISQPTIGNPFVYG